ncbi:MAG: hypothetical protein COV59_01505 [Candidatus Magasanikbacteria bacterium CG11_big_fil_rev_8_21_14_0_20_39_34]|uniref:Uncharacterized protein n=1 Tax=Candidatus Magasanikbacteria bacterium CG11_big_fil_rev_8_21_14_0_20_39_34 TaxID=1974653 RepID=A0A2H0N5W9_9BACT|nr:MAG: hypothetical protein COV59_01505 [Candidatus Magasanikbacteria bacterium CG11_big_fil_rev_8_21_14_0_20_39_34]
MSTFETVLMGMIALFVGIIIAFVFSPLFKKKGKGRGGPMDKVLTLPDHKVGYAWTREPDGRLDEWPYIPGHEGVKSWFFTGVNRGAFTVLRFEEFDLNDPGMNRGAHKLLRRYEEGQRRRDTQPPYPDALLRILLMPTATDSFIEGVSGLQTTLDPDAALRQMGVRRPSVPTIPPDSEGPYYPDEDEEEAEEDGPLGDDEL